MWSGGEFPWSRNGADTICSRLERFLVSLDWEDQFQCSLQTRLSMPLLDHFPVAKLERGKVPFKFENMWLQVERF